MTQFNLGDALRQYKEESEITLLDAGTHTIEISVAKNKSGKAGPTISMFGKVYSGPQAGARVGLGTLSFSEKALWKTFPILKGLGITEDFIQVANSAQDPIKMIADALVGRIADITVNVDTWNGEERNKIDSARPAEGVSFAPPAPAAPQAAVPAAVPATEAAPVLTPGYAPPAPPAVPQPAVPGRAPSF